LKVRTQKAGESLQDFATAIQQLARRAYPASPEENIRREAGKAFEVHAVFRDARSERNNNGASSWTRSPPIQRIDARRSGSWRTLIRHTVVLITAF
jgi:hypothetical protein